jgi:alpha-methylacyl-CoA racemase
MGPLNGIRVIELEAIGPVPWAAMMLSDMGADVLRVDRAVLADRGVTREKKYQLTERGRRSVTADLKDPKGVEAVLTLLSKADILLEGMRPGVMERLGLGPQECLARNPALVYGRMTGWGQTGPLSNVVGHDINYIGITGVLHAIGLSDAPPVPPLNLVGDFGGGGMLLALGVVCGVLEARRSGKGQVVDAAMVDGSISMMASIMGQYASGEWKDQRQSNVLDGGAHFYGVYETSDNRYVAVGAIEPRFYSAFLKGLGLDPSDLPAQRDDTSWPALRKKVADIFFTKTREQWRQIFEGTEACFTPVLSLAEVASHPHHVQRNAFVELDGVLHPAPAPRFSRTPGKIAGPPVERGVGGKQAVADWGFDPDDARLKGLGWSNR